MLDKYICYRTLFPLWQIKVYTIAVISFKRHTDGMRSGKSGDIPPLPSLEIIQINNLLLKRVHI